MTLCTPKYRLHKGSGQALVQLDGQRIYLGKYGTEASKERYRRIVAEWLISKKPATRYPSHPDASPISVNELILAFWQHAQERYVKNGKPTSEQNSFRAALRPVRRLYGHELVTNFGPLALIACRQQLIDSGVCRTRINQHVTRIRHVFKWGVSRELVPETVWRALCSVEGLRFGEAIESEPVRPVQEEHIAAIEELVTPHIWAMINMQIWTGCRPGEACLIRTIDINTQRSVWEYRPHSHKVEHHGKKRIVYFGPHAREVISPWLKPELHAYLFSPRESRELYLAKRTKTRKTPLTPSQRSRKRKASPKRIPGEHYVTNAYGHAVRRACERACVPAWSPNQLRHNAATRIRAAYGIEAARIILGHASAVTSEIYAEIDGEQARQIMAKIG